MVLCMEVLMILSLMIINSKLSRISSSLLNFQGFQHLINRNFFWDTILTSS